MDAQHVMPAGEVGHEGPEFRFGDSPWFWLALFGSVAVVALAIVGQKYARQQARLEARWQNRIQTQNERMLQQSGRPSTGDQVAPAIADRPPQPRASLTPLLMLLAALATAGYVGLYASYHGHAARRDSQVIASWDKP